MHYKAIKLIGIGTDIINIAHFNNDAINDTFLEKIYTEQELAYCYSFNNPAQHLAVRYAGKEAVVKSISDITNFTIDYKDIEIVNNSNGAPSVVINNLDLNVKIYLSLSHCEDKALAYALAIEVNGNE